MIWLEALSYAVTILGFPGAIAVLVYEHRRRSAIETIRPWEERVID